MVNSNVPSSMAGSPDLRGIADQQVALRTRSSWPNLEDKCKRFSLQVCRALELRGEVNQKGSLKAAPLWALVTPPRGLGVDRRGQQGPSWDPPACCVTLGRALSSASVLLPIFERTQFLRKNFCSSSQPLLDFSEGPIATFKISHVLISQRLLVSLRKGAVSYNLHTSPLR